MRNIIIVDCISTGTNYIGDIVNRGYNPIVLEMKPASSDVEGYKDMEEWLRNKVFEEDIAQIAGIYKRDEENNDGE